MPVCGWKFGLHSSFNQGCFCIYETWKSCLSPIPSRWSQHCLQILVSYIVTFVIKDATLGLWGKEIKNKKCIIFSRFLGLGRNCFLCSHVTCPSYWTSSMLPWRKVRERNAHWIGNSWAFLGVFSHDSAKRPHGTHQCEEVRRSMWGATSSILNEQSFSSSFQSF